MKNIKYNIVFLLGLLLLASCEDPIGLKLDKGFEQVTVEAILNTETTLQKIILRGSVPFFDDISTTPAIDNAIVNIVSNTNDTLPFTFAANGEYWFTPSASKKIVLGKTYQLQIELGEEKYFANSEVNPVALWDSLTYEYFEESGFASAGYYATMHARDLPGIGQCYWFRRYKNDTFASGPADINTAYDAGSNPGEFDGEAFGFPNSVGGVNDFDKPYTINDTLRIEIQGISPDFFYFLDEVTTQMENGGLFASPPANVRTNVFNRDQDGRAGLGYFIIGEMEAREVVILP
jgi:hypothetical protein